MNNIKKDKLAKYISTMEKQLQRAEKIAGVLRPVKAELFNKIYDDQTDPDQTLEAVYNELFNALWHLNQTLRHSQKFINIMNTVIVE